MLPAYETPLRCALSVFIDRSVGSAVAGCAHCSEVAAIRLNPRILLVLSLALLMTSCSRTQFLYDRADWLAYRWTADLVDASAVQKPVWRELFRQAMAQHRHQQLPAMVDLLGGLETTLRNGPSEVALTCWGNVADRVYYDHVRWAVPTATAVLGDLSAQQIDHLASELEERNQAYSKKYLDSDPERRREARVQRYVERFERWTGALNADQVRLVEQSLQGLPDLAGDWLAYRRDRQAKLLALLRSGAEPQVLQGFIIDWWADFAGRAPALVRDSQRLREGTLQMIVALEAELTDKQRAELLDKIGQLRAELGAASGLAIAQRLDRPCTDPA